MACRKKKSGKCRKRRDRCIRRCSKPSSCVEPLTPFLNYLKNMRNRYPHCLAVDIVRKATSRWLRMSCEARKRWERRTRRK